MTSQGNNPHEALNGSVAAEVRSWMARRGAKQVDVANALGLSQSGVSHRLRGRVPFTVPELMMVAGLLDVTLADLLGPDILQVRRSPHTELVGAGASGASEKLLRLDSNQQPFD